MKCLVKFLATVAEVVFYVSTDGVLALTDMIFPSRNGR